jgi:hypothetical protein
LTPGSQFFENTFRQSPSTKWVFFYKSQLSDDPHKTFHFDTSIHKDISERLPKFNRGLYVQVKEVLDVNKAQRHIRGGIATRKKYRGV